MPIVDHGRAVIGRALLPFTIAGLVLGLLAAWAGRDELARLCWGIPSLAVAIRLGWSILRDLLAGRTGVDVVALIAMVGALLLGETLAASVIAVMFATGEALEAYADRRAHGELSALLGRAPRTADRYRDGALETVPLEAVVPGDRVVVKPGDVVPVDGHITGEPAILDESALTGESRLVTREAGQTVSSGVVNAGGPFELLAVATAASSTYAGIVRLVEEAQASKAPFVRLADRYAAWFIPLTLGLAAVAWIASGDPERALAVLVVATPCPLLLAAPIAIVAGISRSARRGVIVKGGGPLETLGRARVLLFDKTGTLTAGRPVLTGIETGGDVDPDEVLRLAASVEQLSPHVLAGAIVHAGRQRDLELVLPTAVDETHGSGVSGRVGSRLVAVGSFGFVAPTGRPEGWVRDLRRRAVVEGTTTAFVAVDGTVVGALVLEDPVRPETPRAIRSLRRAGFTRIVMVTGDHAAIADIVGAAIGVDSVLAERTPAEKVDAVRTERADTNAGVVMVGDGINDAPALAVADVGVAMGARGATASSEAADIVIAVDRLDRLADVVGIAHRSRRIAIESVVAGMALSIVAMVVAALGFLPVVAGALLQEAIDVAVILNALRALRGGVEAPIRVPGWSATGARLTEEHREMAAPMAAIRTTADRLDTLDGPAAAAALEATRAFLVDELVPHEVEEDRAVYPMLAAATGTDDTTAALHRTHTEIFRLIRLYDRLVVELPTDGPTAEDRTDLRRILYGLDAILRLHMAQEEDLYASLSDATAPAVTAVAAA